MSINCYPNPFNENFNIKISNYKKTLNGNLKLFNIKGALIYDYKKVKKTGNISLNINNINSKKLPSGIYILSFKNSEIKIQKKIIYAR